MIGNNEESCEIFDPAPVVNLVFPSGGTGNIEYRWLFSGLDCPEIGSSIANNENGPEIDAGYIGSTLYLIRQTRREGCEDWVNSNCVVKEVNICNNGSTNNTLIHLPSDVLSLWIKNKNYKPVDNGWTIFEILEHISLTSYFLLI